MRFEELPQDKQKALLDARRILHVKMAVNTPYRVVRVNKAGTRYIMAQRRQISYSDDRGNYMKFGGGSYWIVSYGEMRWRTVRQPIGNDYDCEWVCSDRHRYRRTSTGVEIPGMLNTKKEVLALIERIGMFND